MIGEDESFVAIPPSKPTALWMLTIRNAKGEYREPTHAETYELIGRPTQAREAELVTALSEALGLLRGMIIVYGGDEETDAVVRRLAELL